MTKKLPKQTYRIMGYRLVVSRTGATVQEIGLPINSTDKERMDAFGALVKICQEKLPIFGELEVREIVEVTTRKYKPRAIPLPEPVRDLRHKITPSQDFHVPSMPN